MRGKPTRLRAAGSRDWREWELEPKKINRRAGRTPSDGEPRELRVFAGLKQREMWTFLAVPRRTWQDWEYDIHAMPGLAFEYACLLILFPEVAEARARWLKQGGRLEPIGGAS